MTPFPPNKKRESVFNFDTIKSMRFNNILPELYVIDFKKSLLFYTDLLGFKLEYQRSDPLFAFLSYQGSQLMIQQEDEDEVWHNGKPEYPFGRGINFQIGISPPLFPGAWSKKSINSFP